MLVGLPFTVRYTYVNDYKQVVLFLADFNIIFTRRKHTDIKKLPLFLSTFLTKI